MPATAAAAAAAATRPCAGTSTKTKSTSAGCTRTQRRRRLCPRSTYTFTCHTRCSSTRWRHIAVEPTPPLKQMAASIHPPSPQSIAIVLSPKHLPSCRVFRLCHPNPPGLREVQECHMSKPELRNRHHPDHKRGDSSEPGAHGDPRGAVYEEAPHVRFDPQRNVKLVDLRR